MGIILNTLLMIIVAIAIPGVINRTRAVLAGRQGLPFVQHLRNVNLLLRKGAVYSTTTTALFRIAPAVYLGAAIVALLFIPVADLYPLISFDGDVICFGNAFQHFDNPFYRGSHIDNFRLIDGGVSFVLGQRQQFHGHAG